MTLLEFTDEGILCPPAGVHIDPWRPVERALVTHGHADHARPGHGRYLCTEQAAPVIRHRLGDIRLETIAFGDTLTIDGVAFSFHPAGHIPGSAQIRVEHRGEVWVVSGDYKTEPDRLSEPFEIQPCNVFVTECTFGLPVFKWRPQDEVFAQIDAWWRDNASAGRASVIGAYSLGKAQRLLAGVNPEIGPIFTHGAVENINDILRAQGFPLPPTTRVTPDSPRKQFAGSLVVAPPSAVGSTWVRRLGPASTAFASGWMALRGLRRRRAADRGFVLSDHADWPALNATVEASGAECVYATHGYTSIFRRWLESRGYNARVAETQYEGERLGEAGNSKAGEDDAAAAVDG